MRSKRMILALVAIAAVAVVIAPTLVKASASEATVDQPPAAEPAPAGLSQEPVPAHAAPPPESSCYVMRPCAYPPPSSISCSGTFDCLEGSDGYGWVECDFVRTYCSGPSCSGGGTPCLKGTDCSCTCGGYCSIGRCVCIDEEPLS